MEICLFQIILRTLPGVYLSMKISMKSENLFIRSPQSNTHPNKQNDSIDLASDIKLTWITVIVSGLKNGERQSGWSKGFLYSESMSANWATNHMATGDGQEKEVQQIFIIWEHDSQITGPVIACANCTITETSNYHDMDLVMTKDEWERDSCMASDFVPPPSIVFHH